MEDARRALMDADAVLLDMDGVLWHSMEAIPDVAKALAALREAGKRMIFVTNNSSRSRAFYVRKLKRVCGIDVDTDHVLTSAVAAAAACRGVSKVYAIGESGLFEELRAADGIGEVLGEGDEKFHVNPQAGDPAPSFDSEVGAVVVGFDGELSYFKMARAMRCLREGTAAAADGKKCRFIACNTDMVVPAAGGVLLPGSGVGVVALQACTGIAPEVFGKPEPALWQLAAEHFGLDARRCVMVGDSLATDIAFGKRCGLRTLLVLSGVTKQAQLDNPALPADQRPDFVAASLGAVFSSS